MDSPINSWLLIVRKHHNNFHILKNVTVPSFFFFLIRGMSTEMSGPTALSMGKRSNNNNRHQAGVAIQKAIRLSARYIGCPCFLLLVGNVSRLSTLKQMSSTTFCRMPNATTIPGTEVLTIISFGLIVMLLAQLFNRWLNRFFSSF